jgi:hypothetical protein
MLPLTGIMHWSYWLDACTPIHWYNALDCPQDVKPRELDEVLRLEYRSKLLNPR